MMLRRDVGRRVVSCLFVAPLLAGCLLACFNPRLTTLDDFREGRVPTTEQLRLKYPQGSVILSDNWILRYPLIEAQIDEIEGTVPHEPVAGTKRSLFNLEDATELEIYAFSRAKTAGVATGTVLGVLGVLVGLIFLIGPGLSCPHVYVDAGDTQQLVGEAYPGAIFGSLERADYLALPDVTNEGVLRIAIRNDHHESQFLESIMVGSVRHRSDQTAVATANGIVVTGREAQLVAAAANGRDVLEVVRRSDGSAWQSVPAGRVSPDDEVRVTYLVAEAGTYALVAVAENTHWYERVFGEAVRDAGASYKELLDDANGNSSAELVRWRDAANIDLLVSGGAGGATSRVMPFGTAAFRTQVVAEERVAANRTVSFVLKSGAHYWRIDSLRLVQVVEPAPDLTIHAATATRVHQQRVLAASQSKSIRLAEKGDRIDLEFALPQSRETRSLFLVTRGFYNIHPNDTRAGREIRPIREVAAGLAKSVDLTKVVTVVGDTRSD